MPLVNAHPAQLEALFYLENLSRQQVQPELLIQPQHSGEQVNQPKLHSLSTFGPP